MIKTAAEKKAYAIGVKLAGIMSAMFTPRQYYASPEAEAFANRNFERKQRIRQAEKEGPEAYEAVRAQMDQDLYSELTDNQREAMKSMDPNVVRKMFLGWEDLPPA